MAFFFFLCGKGRGFCCRLSLSGSLAGYNRQQRLTLVNVRLKWVKDWTLDTAVKGKKDLSAACTVISMISTSPERWLPIYHLAARHKQLGLPANVRVSTFLRRYPSVFQETRVVECSGNEAPYFRLTHDAEDIRRDEVRALEQSESDLVDRLCKLLMLTRDMILPFQIIDQLRWDMGLPNGYANSLIPKFPELFELVSLPDDRLGLKLRVRDDRLAVSALEQNSVLQNVQGRDYGGCLAFPIRFTRGFGLKKKCMSWLEEWQQLPYTSPYCDPSHLDSRTDVSEKRIVGVFHELLHLTLHKQTERSNVSNLRKPLSLPQRFSMVFERHPGIFYISKKDDVQTVVLREAYDGRQLLNKHPLVGIRERYAAMMKQGFLDKSRGLYKKHDFVDKLAQGNMI